MKKVTKWQRIMSTVTVVSSLFAILMVSVMVGNLLVAPLLRGTPTSPPKMTAEIERQMDDFRSQMELVTSILEAVQQTLNTATKDPNSLALVGLQADIKQVSLEVKSIRDALGSDLERTLSVPLLRKDIQKLEEQFAERTIAATKEIDRIYDLGKWFLGVMVGVAVSVLGLVVTTFLPTKKKDDAA